MIRDWYQPRRGAIAGGWLAAAGVAVALVVTLVPIHEPAAAPGVDRPILDLRDFILNLGLLGPVGAGLRLRGWRTSALLGCVLALSSSIELLQLLLPLGRDASFLDIMANTTGAGIAAWLVPQVSRGLTVSASGARWLAAAVLFAWCVQVVMTAWALQRDTPEAAQYYGQWAHVFGDTEELNGTVEDFTIQGLPVPDDAAPNTAAVRAALAGDTVTVRVVVTDLGPSVGRAQVAAVTDGEGDLVAGFERHGCRIRFSRRTRGERVGLRPLSVTLPTSCRLESGATELAGRATPRSLALTATWGSGQARQASLALTPSLGWRLFVPRRWTGGAWDVLGSIAWLALWGAPLALWLRAAWPANPARTALVYAVSLLGSAALVAIASRLALGTPGDVPGVVLGWALGGLAGLVRSTRTAGANRA